MPKLTNRVRRRQLDQSLRNLKHVDMPDYGYIREVREALEMSTYQLAERMGVRQSTVTGLEESERSKSITLRSLEHAASALGCKVVYALVPDKSLEEAVQDQARLRAQEMSKSLFRTMALEQQATDQIVQDELIEELAADILRKGKRELWKR